ncbi:hypothetical protein MVEN_01436700 [Mycena venus]|uniref:Uncharacterized protein n=1 Tax=Mycena venus TaxID=2733690 RepID=A0A8H6XZD8_9AGAR|nr:hypothetical protein MVEN_01436700 [Mycena venus]
MSSTPSNTLATVPTLILAPSFTLEPTPALAPIPIAAATALSEILDQAAQSAITSEEVAVAASIRPSASFLDDDGSFDHEFEEGRVTKVEAAVTALQATVESHTNTLQVILARTSTNAGTAPPAPSASDAAVLAGIDPDLLLRAVVQEYVNVNGKRARTDDEVVEVPAAKHAHIGVVIPPPFAYPTAPIAPDYAAVGFRAARRFPFWPESISSYSRKIPQKGKHSDMSTRSRGSE